MSDLSPPGSDHADRSSKRRSGGPVRPGGSPNYAIRRVAVGAAGVVAVAISAIVIGRAFTGDDARSSAGSVDADWSHVVVLTSDEIQVVDPGDGEIVDRWPATGDLLDDQSLVEGQMLVTMTDFGRITITDLTDGSVRRGQAGTDETLLRSPDAPGIAFVGSDGGGDLTVIDIAERQILSVGDVAGLDSPLMFATSARANPSATHVAVSDGRSFQTIVVDLAEGASIPLAGQIVAIDDERVVTAQRAGASTELEFYDLGGERLGSVDVATPVASMLGPSGEVLTVDAVAQIRLAGADGVDEVGPLTVSSIDGDDRPADTASEGVAAAGNTRLIVTTDGRTVLLDDRGDQLHTDPAEVNTPVTGLTRCVQIGGSFGNTSSIVDLDRGSIIGDLDSLVASITSPDGCTIAVIGSGSVLGDDPRILVDEEGTGTLVWHDRTLIEIIGDSVSAIAPDGSAVAVADGIRTLLVDLGDGNAVELAATPVVVHFANR